MMMRLQYVVLFVSVFLVFFTVYKIYGQKKENQLKYEDFKKRIANKNIQLIDVRTTIEYKQGAIKNAKNINVLSDDFLNQIKKVDKNRPVYLYCRSGKRSQKAMKILKQNGFKEIYDLEGGYLNWKKNQ